ncbi:hypothetical protein [Paenarthrobacter sp. NPDC057981]|uniref:hypothetical protein n=1 Tax=Paenarthrobacter sp. NPDC057981 TaxID=3346297 RepID=UPI0036DACA94
MAPTGSTREAGEETVPVEEALPLVPDGETRFQRYCLGFIDLIMGCSAGWITFMNTVDLKEKFQNHQTVGTPAITGWNATVVAVVASFAVVSLFGLVVGVWNLLNLRTMSRQPLTAAIVFSALSAVLSFIFLTGPARILLALFHVFLIILIFRILRQEWSRSRRSLA